jgi:hypothetical protein
MGSRIFEILFPLEWGGDDVCLSIQDLGCPILMTILLGERVVSILRTVVSFGER